MRKRNRIEPVDRPPEDPLNEDAADRLDQIDIDAGYAAPGPARKPGENAEETGASQRLVDEGEGPILERLEEATQDDNIRVAPGTPRPHKRDRAGNRISEDTRGPESKAS